MADKKLPQDIPADAPVQGGNPGGGKNARAVWQTRIS